MGRASLERALYVFMAVAVAAVPGFSAEEGKKAKKKEAEGADVLVWDNTGLTEIKVVQRLMRLNKSGQWGPDRLPKLAQMAIDTDRKLLKQLGHWYLALTAGRDGSPPQALDHLKKAVSFGFSNVVAILEATEFSDLTENAEFKALVEELTKRVEKESRDRFTARTDASFAASKEAAGSPWVPDLKTSSGEPFWQGRPTVVVVTRVHHEGFEKLLGRLKEISDEKAKDAGLAVLFYQEDRGNERRAAQAHEYAEKLGRKLGIQFPHAVIGRKEYKDLDSRMLANHAKVQASAPPAAAEDDGSGDPGAGPLNVFPLIVGFFGKQGEFHHAICGVPEIWQIEYALGKLAEAVPATPGEAIEKPEPPPAEPKPPAADPAEPAPPAEPKADAPAEKPAAESESPPPENGAPPEEKKGEPAPERGEGEPGA